MKLVKYAVLLVILLAIGGLFLPSHYSVSRSLVIPDDSAVIHSYVGNLEEWDEWMPWIKADPSIVMTPGEIEEGVGSGMSWTSRNSGSGNLVITDSADDVGLEYDIEIEGNKAKGSILYETVDAGTRVTWSMRGNVEKPPVVAPYIALSMDFTMGSMFDQGLRDLRDLVLQRQ